MIHRRNMRVYQSFYAFVESRARSGEVHKMDIGTSFLLMGAGPFYKRESTFYHRLYVAGRFPLVRAEHGKSLIEVLSQLKPEPSLRIL